MSFQTSLKLAVALKLGVTVNDILDVDVRWDDGDRYDPTYPSDNVAPTFEVRVKVLDYGKEVWKSLEPEFTFTALLRAVLLVSDER